MKKVQFDRTEMCSGTSIMSKNTKHRSAILSVLCFFCVLLSAQPRAKYVFYFIGDGMGVNQVNGAETFLAAQEGRIGTTPLCFPSFPYIAYITTQSALNGVTDSAAGGTALACGHKTKNGAIGVLQDLTTPIKSVATAAKECGAAVGIATSVSPDHATPAVFYAHEASRKSYYEIGRQLTGSGFDFFAGSDFLKPNPKDNDDPHAELHQMAQDSGYTIARGFADYRQKSATAKKMLLLQPESDKKQWPKTTPYKIDRKPGNLSLEDITTAGIDFLRKRADNGFFFMVEGGMIDMACHDNDAATYVHELIDFDSCIQIAYDFYLQHPDSTLIVVTADHETGGLVLGRGPYELHLDRLAAQKMGLYQYTSHLSALRREKGTKLSWEDIQKDLQEHFGFWSELSLTEKQTQRLKSAFDGWMSGKEDGKKTMYSDESALCTVAGQIISEQAGISWASYGHSNGYVGAYAIGAGAEAFHGRFDNTEIPRIIARLAGWNLDK